MFHCRWHFASDIRKAGDILPRWRNLCTYVPVMLANARALAAGQAEVYCVVGGTAWRQQAFPYQGKCVRWLREEREALSENHRRAVDRVLEETGRLPLFMERIGP